MRHRLKKFVADLRYSTPELIVLGIMLVVVLVGLHHPRPTLATPRDPLLPFACCMTGPGSMGGMVPECAKWDLDVDWDVDLMDFCVVQQKGGF